MTAQPSPIFEEPALSGKPSTTSSGRLETPVAELERECGTFCRYLSGRAPNRYVVEKYVAYHRLTGAFAGPLPFDAALVRLAARGPWLARLADSYSARFARGSVLRKKLALALGILECSPGFVEHVDTADSGPRPLVFARMGLAVAASALALAVSLALIGPLHAALRRRR
jgi:hypothetical protein